MILDVKDRLILLQILPFEGDVTLLRIIRRLQDELSFNEEEHSSLTFKLENGRTSWNPEVKIERDFNFGPKTLSVICAAFEKMDREKRLTLEILPLYDKFIGDKE